MARCGLHLPANIQCPNPALYRVETVVNEPKAYETEPPVFRAITRELCAAHLEAGILAGLEHTPNDHFSAVVTLL